MKNPNTAADPPISSVNTRAMIEIVRSTPEIGRLAGAGGQGAVMS